MVSKKRCGSCRWYIKWKNNNHKSSGFCERCDGRTDSGNSVCKNWKGIKYKRKRIRLKPYPFLLIYFYWSHFFFNWNCNNQFTIFKVVLILFSSKSNTTLFIFHFLYFIK